MNTHDKIELPQLPKLPMNDPAAAHKILNDYGKACANAAIEAGRQRRGPLTDEQIRIIWKETKARMGCGGDPILWFARAIERAHGIPAPQPADPVKAPSEDERAAQGLPPYSPRNLTDEEWRRLTENGRRAWGKQPAVPTNKHSLSVAEPEKEPPCET